MIGAQFVTCLSGSETSVAEIASLLGCSSDHCTDRVIKKTGFLKPRIEFPQKMRLWDKDE